MPMPVKPAATIEITAFRWVPPFAAGLVRDLRIRWALEEIGRDYRVRLLDALNPRPEEYFAEQPFGQVPVYRDAGSPAVRERRDPDSSRLEPTNGCCRRDAQWPDAWHRLADRGAEQRRADDLRAGQHRHLQPRPGLDEGAPAAGRREDSRAAEAAGRCAWRQGLVRRPLHHRRPDDGHGAAQSAPHRTWSPSKPTLAAFVARGEARPAFQRALADQLAVFDAHQPERKESSMTYFEGFVVPVPEANKEEYRKHASDAAPHLQGVWRQRAMSRPGTATCPRARSPTSAGR